MHEGHGQIAATDSIAGRVNPLSWLAGGAKRSYASALISFAVHGGLLAVVLGVKFTSQSPKRTEGIEVTYSQDVFVSSPENTTNFYKKSLADDVIAQVQRDGQASAQAIAQGLEPMAARSVGFDHDERVARLVADGSEIASDQKQFMQSALADSESAGQGHHQRLSALVEAGKGQFCGIPLGDARKIVYLLDHSGSMGSLLAAVKEHLLETIESLDGSKQFHVMYFSSGKPVELSGRAIRLATPARKQLARRFLQTNPDGSGTDPADALVRAFSLKPDVIYLLSDGQFSERILDFVTQLNPNRRVTLNTICMGKRDGQNLMKALAESNGGRFRLIRF